MAIIAKANEAVFVSPDVFSDNRTNQQRLMVRAEPNFSRTSVGKTCIDYAVCVVNLTLNMDMQLSTTPPEYCE